MPSDGTSETLSWNWKPAAARSYAKYTHSDASSETVAPDSDRIRTSSGLPRATTRTRTAAINGAHVITERIGSPLTSVTSAPRRVTEGGQPRHGSRTPPHGHS